MSTRERPADRGRRLAHRSIAGILDELLRARTALGISQQAIADAIGVSRSTVGRLERGEIADPKLEEMCAVAAVLGLSLRMNVYPEGEPLHDRVQLRLLESFRGRLHPSIAWRTEVPLPIQGDRRAWDAVAIADDGWTGVEAISRMGEVDGVLRRANQKQRDDPRIARVVLVVGDTVRNREALRVGASAIRAEYPLDTRATMAALAAGRSPALSGVVILRVSRDPPRNPPRDRLGPGRPQVVHSRGELVDGASAARRRIVENPVGAAPPAP